MTIKARAAIMLKFHGLVRDNAHELAQLIVHENGKNMNEALADVAKGNETVEYACSLPQLAQGQMLRVSGEATCFDRRDALGICASIVPFNFPFMVPMWTLGVATVLGNAMILKPSEKVPLTMRKTMELVEEAGFPPGVIQLVQGQGPQVVDPLMEHKSVKAITFVGSSPVAKLVAEKCHSLHKRVLALGGAKNHLVVLGDCDVESAAQDITVSFAGCAGQRCMAASVLLLVGDGPSQQAVLHGIIEKAAAIPPGCASGELGPVIDQTSYHKIQSYLADAEANGAEILLDGRSDNWASGEKEAGGYWMGPTVIHHTHSSDKAVREEIFGPVLSVYTCSSWEEALEIENSNEFGNAASVYTSNGGAAEWFTSKFRAGMLGVNIGIPVPREPFSFGGLAGTKSKYGGTYISAYVHMLCLYSTVEFVDLFLFDVTLVSYVTLYYICVSRLETINMII
jgi:malonate-semialdehyde dehydrogenase (acetylating)/methylmalonate-semialdehyde dehydrogenase